jgi:hypothetical protein
MLATNCVDKILSDGITGNTCIPKNLLGLRLNEADSLIRCGMRGFHQGQRYRQPHTKAGYMGALFLYVTN